MVYSLITFLPNLLKKQYRANEMGEYFSMLVLSFNLNICMQTDSEILLSITKTKMPFGKYKNTLLCDLPVSYLEWFARKGFPAGKLGMQLQTIYEIKLNGLEYLLNPLR